MRKWLIGALMISGTAMAQGGPGPVTRYMTAEQIQNWCDLLAPTKSTPVPAQEQACIELRQVRDDTVEIVHSLNDAIRKDCRPEEK